MVPRWTRLTERPGAITDPDARLVLASTSPQRRAILTQLRIPHEVVAPDYREQPGRDPLEHAAGKARSVSGGGLPVLGVDTVVVCAGAQIGKPRDRAEAQATLQTLSGTTHTVVSGLCLRTSEWEELHRVTTLVSFRTLGVRELERYLLEGEWEGRGGRLRDSGSRRGIRRANRRRLPERRRAAGRAPCFAARAALPGSPRI